MADLLNDVRSLARATHFVGWASGVGDHAEAIGSLADPGKISGKQIRMDQWMRGFMAAMALSKESPYLDRPIPAAYPDGFVGFTWTQGDRRGLRLEIRDDGYVWTQNDENGKRTVKTDSLQDVAEAMRAVFPRVSC